MTDAKRSLFEPVRFVLTEVMKAEGNQRISAKDATNGESTIESETSSVIWFEQNETPSVSHGLHNLGNTCYLNSVLQVMMNTPFLMQTALFAQQKPKSFQHTCQPTGPHAVCYTCETLQLCNQLRHKAISPGVIVDNLKYLNKRFSRHKQQDAHEFFLLLLNRLDSCFRRPFQGSITSSVRCKRNHVSVTTEEFLNLTLDIHQIGTLQNAIKRHFLESGTIKGYMCAGCNNRVDITKKYDWKSMPNYLVLHLNRFDRFANKIGTHVEFDTQLRVSDTPYNLFGIVEHLGNSIDFGHYIAYVMSAGGVWYRVRLLDE